MKRPGLATFERLGNFLELQEDGALTAAEQDRGSSLEELEGYAGPDCSFVEYIDRMDPPLAQRFAEIGYVEGFNAADANEASVLALGLQQKAEDAIAGDRAWRVRDGYDRVPAFLLERAQAAGAKLLLNARACTVEWMPGGASVLTDDGRAFTAPARPDHSAAGPDGRRARCASAPLSRIGSRPPTPCAWAACAASRWW